MKRAMNAAIMMIAAGLIVSTGMLSRAADACPKDKAAQAAAAAGGIKTWAQALDFHKRFAACDAGEVSDVVGEAVESLLLKQWDTLPEAAKLAATDAQFEKFIVRHAGEAFSEEGAAEVIKRCAGKCPSGADKLCKLISAALRE